MKSIVEKDIDENCKRVFEGLYSAGVIYDDMIINFFNLDSNIVFEYLYDKKISYAIKVLSVVYFTPFILLEVNISNNLRKSLPNMISNRYQEELRELDSEFDLEYISADEYIENKKYLKDHYKIEKVKNYTKVKKM